MNDTKKVEYVKDYSWTAVTARRRTTTKEALTTEDVIEEHLKVEVFKVRGKTLKIRLMRGWPDRLVLLQGGRLCFFELKRPKGGKFEPLQERIHKMLRDMGFYVFVCKTKDEVDEALNAVA